MQQHKNLVFGAIITNDTAAAVTVRRNLGYLLIGITRVIRLKAATRKSLGLIGSSIPVVAVAKQRKFLVALRT